MYKFLFQKIKETIAINDDEFEFVKTLFIPKKLKRRRYLLSEGDICKYTIFVEKGLLRSFTTDEKGTEHTLQFSMEGWWAADLYSFFTEEPTQFHIEALEESEVLLLSKPSWDLLLEKVPSFERYFRILIQNNLIATQRRLIGSFSETAEEKYNNLLLQCPSIVQRVPQHMIASYIGISRETLSRIRSNSLSNL
ncbi:MAG TPA: Crp/Fnr family transcriptional regulator [Salinimicrobium sp.]|nr:Crp/Fnr family transcriptional regulator [Salinimicrobium sp.]